jgi:O-antigen chain-terminating methyltransferase
LEADRARMMDVLDGVSPDYAVIAQKDAGRIVLAAASEAFDKDYGIDPQEICRRFDRHLAARTEKIAAEIGVLEQRIGQAEDRARQADERARALFAQLEGVYRSTSWSVTRPLRLTSRLVSSLTWRVKQLIRLPLAAGIGLVLRSPMLAAWLGPLLRRVPGLHRRLRRVAVNTGVIVPAAPPSGEAAPEPQEQKALAQATPAARRAYGLLETAIAERNRDNHA